MLPVSYFLAHDFEVVFAKIPWLSPVDMDNLVDLVDGSLDQIQRHCLHDKQFNVLVFNLAGLSDHRKRNAPLVFSKLKDHFQESNDPDLLLEVGHLVKDVGEPADEFLVCLHCGVKLVDLALSQRLKHVEHPFKVSSEKRVDNFFVKKLTDVKNFLSKHDRHAHLDAQLLFIVLRHFGARGVSEELEAALEIVLVVVLSLVVETVNLGESREHLSINVTKILDLFSNQVQLLNAIVMLS